MLDNIDNDDSTRQVVIPGPGVEISHYRLTRKLGLGGMGEVFLAHDNNLERQVALKFLAPNFATDKTFRERFMREARLAAALNHPNIITIYEVAEHDSRVFIAMEYVEGTSLREMIDNGKLTLDRCLNIALQICDGLATAHKLKLIHRDIKPANIIVDNTNRVRILDFGLAKSEADGQLTQAGMTMGTVNYMSPEQGQGQSPDNKGDIFSLGVVLYEMLTGRLPFKEDNIPATLYAIVNNQPPPLMEYNPDLPEKLQSIIDKALTKIPAERYQDIKELKKDLQSLREPDRTSRPVPADQSLGRAEVKSLAVLYLRNLGSSDDEYLSYGITEDLIIDLTRLGSVRVASMRSILKYKDSDAELDEIAGNLKADLILDGSILKSENSIRISAQLIDVASGENLWAERWEESPDNLPHIKKALADGIGKALDLGQTVIQQAQIGKPEASDAQAYENYLKAKYSFDHKQDRSDVDIALGLYSLALKEEPDLLAARAGIAEIMMYNGDYTSARIELDSALDEALSRNLKAEQADILRLLAGLHAKQAAWIEAHEHAEKALAINKEMGDLAGEASTLGVLISILQPQSKFDEAILLFDRVLELSRQLDDQEKIAEALKNMGVAYSRKGEYDRALSLYEECCELAKSQNNLALQASCLSNTGNVYFFQGKFDMAFKHYEEALTIARQIGDRTLAARQNLNMGLIHLQTGKHKDGLKSLESAAEVFDSLGDRSTYALTLVNISQARLTMGNFEQAVSAAEKALEIGREINQPLVKTDALVQLGSAHFFNRNIETAVQYFQEALEIAEKSNMSRNIAHIHLALVNICYYCKNYDKCKKHATKALSISREIGEKSALLLSNAGLAAVDACQGLFNTGLKQLQDVYRGIEKIGNRQMTIQLKALLGEVLLKHGKTDKDRNDGQAMLQEALSSAKDNELAPEIKLIDEIISA